MGILNFNSDISIVEEFNQFINNRFTLPFIKYILLDLLCMCALKITQGTYMFTLLINAGGRGPRL